MLPSVAQAFCDAGCTFPPLLYYCVVMLTTKIVLLRSVVCVFNVFFFFQSHHEQSAIEFHYVWEKAGDLTVNISKTQYPALNKLKGKICIVDWTGPLDLIIQNEKKP